MALRRYGVAAFWAVPLYDNLPVLSLLDIFPFGILYFQYLYLPVFPVVFFNYFSLTLAYFSLTIPNSVYL